jgi:hypothetical protein
MIGQLARAHASWGCGTAQRWGLDQQTGLITWTFADKTATAPAQILASYNTASSTWLWAWANESILPAMSRDARGLRDWAQQHGHHSLTQAELPADAETAAPRRAGRAHHPGHRRLSPEEQHRHPDHHVRPRDPHHERRHQFHVHHQYRRGVQNRSSVTVTGQRTG